MGSFVLFSILPLSVPNIDENLLRFSVPFLVPQRLRRLSFRDTPTINVVAQSFTEVTRGQVERRKEDGWTNLTDDVYVCMCKLSP